MHSKYGCLLLFWVPFYFESVHLIGKITSPPKPQVQSVCPRCVKSCCGLTETVAGRGTTLQSHAPRQLQTHACTHAHARARVHTQPQSSCRDVLTRSAQKPRHASGGRRTFQLMSGSFSAVTAKICLPVCGFQEERASNAHVCHNSSCHNSQQGNYDSIMVCNQYIRAMLTN